MLSYLLICILVLAAVASGHFGRLKLRERRRSLATRLPEGTAVVRQARSVPVRVFVNQDVVAGPSARGINRGPADLVLTEGLFLLGTHQGRLLELRPGDRRASPLAPARCVGPRRLVVEGVHPSGKAEVRAELILDDAEGWARDVSRLVAATA